MDPLHVWLQNFHQAFGEGSMCAFRRVRYVPDLRLVEVAVHPVQAVPKGIKVGGVQGPAPDLEGAPLSSASSRRRPPTWSASCGTPRTVLGEHSKAAVARRGSSRPPLPVAEDSTDISKLKPR